MSKKFRLLSVLRPNEVSLCTKYNSGANKQTEFELVKDKDGKVENYSEVIQKLYEVACDCAPCVAGMYKDEVDGFIDFVAYYLEDRLNSTYYDLLSDGMLNTLSDIKYADLPIEEKELLYVKLFGEFLEVYKNLPITKNSDGRLNVSLLPQSHNQEQGDNPQNETDDITKEKTSEMANEETKEISKSNIFEQALELLKSAFNMAKTEAPADENTEVQPEEVKEEVVEEPAEKAEDEAPVVEDAEETAEEKAPETEEVVEEQAPEVEEEVAKAEEEAVVEEKAEEVVEEPEVKEEVVEEQEETAEEPAKEVEEEVAKASEPSIEEVLKAKMEVEKELAEIKKANELKEIEIEKMSFVQKAKDEYSMLVGTPDEIGEKLYSISKSNLGEDVKDFILEQFKNVAKVNEELTQEVGSISKNAGDLTEEDTIYAKAEEIAKSRGISVKQALREIK